MPLFNIMPFPREVTAKKCETADWVKAVRRKAHPKTFERIVKTLDEGIERIIVENDGKLVWAKTGSLMGHKSGGPKRDIDHAWDAVIDVVGDGRPCVFAMGQLTKWRIAVRPETWLMFLRDVEKVDPLTGDEIFTAEYWINEAFRLRA